MNLLKKHKIKLITDKKINIKNYFNTTDKKVCLIIDNKVEELYQNDIEINYNHLISVEALETSKDLTKVTEIYNTLLENNYNRYDIIVAIGGGIIGDLAGYIAATYKRGINLISIPTTLLAQVDSSVGSKVAVNLNGFKNVIGTFNEPQLTLISPNFLNTLDEDTLKYSYSEIIKYTIISKFKYDLLSDDIDTTNLITESIYTKLSFVEQDLYDTGIRNYLNYGHSLAHLIEQKYHYSHAYAVCQGMYMSAVIFENTKIIDYLKKVYLKYNLEINYEISLDLNLLLSDKKMQNNKLKEVIARDLGVVEIVEIEIQEYIKRYSELWIK